MATQISSPPEPILPGSREVLLVASGDSRPSANEVCWPAQAGMERKLSAAFAAEGFDVRRAHPYDPATRHGFLSSQRMGMDAFATIHPEARVVVAEAVWQYSHHVLPGLRSHRGPILTAANWSGQWPGLVGMLNLNGSMYKAGVPFATIWSLDFTDDFFRRGRVECVHHIPNRHRADVICSSKALFAVRAVCNHLRHHSPAMADTNYAPFRQDGTARPGQALG